MNALSVQALGYGFGHDTFAHRLAQLPPHEQKEVVERAIMWGVQRGVSGWIEENRLRGMRGMGALGQAAVTDAITIAVQRAIEPMIPVLGRKLMEIAEPAAQKAAAVVGPVIEEKLREYGPKLAVITGVVAAILSIIGMAVIGGFVVSKVG